MSKHTSGPWSACCLDRCPHHVFGPNGDEIICDLNHNEPDAYGYDEYNGIVTIDQRQANARLIAAAPDLLEALENLENDDNSIPSYAWDMVQSAIAKAKGGQP
jgi:hypothetical protein